MTSVLVYDEPTDTWTADSNLNVARYALAAATIGSTMYAVGGIESGTVIGVAVEAVTESGGGDVAPGPTRREVTGAVPGRESDAAVMSAGSRLRVVPHTRRFYARRAEAGAHSWPPGAKIAPWPAMRRPARGRR